MTEALTNLDGEVVAGREPHANAGEPGRRGIAVHQPGEHGGYADDGSDAEGLDPVQRAGDIEMIEEAAANAGHQAVEGDADGHDVGPGKRDQRQRSEERRV